MDGTAKELRQLHGVAISSEIEGQIDQLHRRWNQLHIECVDRQRGIQDLLSEFEIPGSGDLQGNICYLVGLSGVQKIFQESFRSGLCCT